MHLPPPPGWVKFRHPVRVRIPCDYDYDCPSHNNGPSLGTMVEYELLGGIGGLKGLGFGGGGGGAASASASASAIVNNNIIAAGVGVGGGGVGVGGGGGGGGSPPWGNGKGRGPR